MQIHFTPEQEAQLSEVAHNSGTEAEQFVKDAALRLSEDIRFREGVERGIAAAERGEFVEHTEVWNRLQEILRS